MNTEKEIITERYIRDVMAARKARKDFRDMVVGIFMAIIAVLLVGLLFLGIV
jgi:hypothetical protein